MRPDAVEVGQLWRFSPREEIYLIVGVYEETVDLYCFVTKQPILDYLRCYFHEKEPLWEFIA